jgi:hypothetical protein
VGGVRRDSDRDGVIEFEVTTSGAASEYVVIVKPEGASGHEAQLYALSVDVSGACVPDSNDTSAPGNATPATSTPLRVAPESGEANDVVAASLCGGATSDVDVYELLALSGETITARISGLVGARLRVGRRPANLNNAAVTLEDGEATAGANGIAAVTFTSATFQTLYLSVDRTAAAGVGNYQLTVDYTLPVDTDEDGVTDDGGDPDDADACVPAATAARCDADEDGLVNDDDPADADPCDPAPDAIACGTGDADQDGTTNAEDSDDTNVCVPDADVVACAEGDADGDGEPNGSDADDANVCVPTPNESTCDADADGTIKADDLDDTDECVPTPNEDFCDADQDGTDNVTDADDANVCVPTPDEGACDADGDGVLNDDDIAIDDACKPSRSADTCDADGDGVTVGEGDTAEDDACVPTNDPGCADADADGDGTDNASDVDDGDPCAPDVGAVACTG